MLIEYYSKVPESSNCFFWVVFAACLSLVNTWIKTRWDGPGRQSAHLCMIIGGKRVRSCNWFVHSSRKTKRLHLLPLEKTSIDHFTVACCIACCFFFFAFPRFSGVKDAVLVSVSRNLRKKSSKVSIKTGSTPATFSFKGQATKHNCKMAKLAICGDGELL